MTLDLAVRLQMTGEGGQLLNPQQEAQHHEEMADKLSAVVGQYITRDIIQKYSNVEEHSRKTHR